MLELLFYHGKENRGIKPSKYHGLAIVNKPWFAHGLTMVRKPAVKTKSWFDHDLTTVINHNDKPCRVLRKKIHCYHGLSQSWFLSNISKHPIEK